MPSIVHVNILHSELGFFHFVHHLQLATVISERKKKVLIFMNLKKKDIVTERR